MTSSQITNYAVEYTSFVGDEPVASMRYTSTAPITIPGEGELVQFQTSSGFHSGTVVWISHHIGRYDGSEAMFTSVHLQADTSNSTIESSHPPFDS